VVTPGRSGSSPDRFTSAGRSRRKDAETGQAPAPGATARRTKPVRITVDLDPVDYRAMRRLVDELADRADVPTLAHSAMWRVLLRQAAADPARWDELAAQIRADLTG
jgi:hypothetical protein